LAAVTAAILLSLSMASGTLAPRRIEAVVSKTMMRREPGPLRGQAWSGGQRAVDRVIERQIRGAIRADPFLLLAAPAVKVGSRHGVVRLVGRVRTPKERSSIAFKAGQYAPPGRIDDRLSVGD
jgi:osmotically-inducible protein OsmY